MKNLFKNRSFKMVAIIALLALIIFPFADQTFAGGLIMAIVPLAALSDDDMASILNKVKESQTEVTTKAREEFEKSIKGMVTEDKLKSQLKEFTDEELTAIKSTMETMGIKNAEILEIMKAQGTELNGLKEKGILLQQARKQTPNTFKEKMAAILTGIFKTDEFKSFEEKGFKGGTNQYTLDEKGEVIEKNSYDEVRTKSVGISTDHTGDVLIAEISGNVRDIPLRKTHIRNLMTVRPTAAASIVAPEVYSYTDAFTMGATTLAENTESPLSVFKTKENTWAVKRISRSIEISKRYFKVNGLNWVMNWILSRLPDQIQYVEDFQLLFGDGTGNNILGITKQAQSMNLTGDYAAGAIASIATNDSGASTLVTFAAAHKLRNGDNVTFAATTGGTYNHSYTGVIVVNQTQIIIAQAYTADAGVANWTGTWFSYWYHAIDNCQEFDVISVAKALLNANEYEATGVVLNSNTAEKLGLLKDLYGAYIGVSRDAMGKLNINAMPIAVSNAIPAGHYLVGDFQRACELAELTPLTIQISEDTSDKKLNQVTVIAEEEVIFPVYNPYWFIYGRFAEAMALIEKP